MDQGRDGRLYYIYVLECCGDSYYVGQTAHLVQRMFQHYSGCGAAWTKKNPPRELVHLEVRYSRYDAEQRERQWFKLLKRKEKSFCLPPEFEEFFYRIAAIATEPTDECKEYCKKTVKVPRIQEWLDGFWDD